MLRILIAGTVGLTMCVAGLATGAAQEPTKSTKTEIPGGIVGQVKSVDVEKQTLRITTENGRERTFTITDDTTMLGPRGGRVRQRLRDRRFHEGMDITVVASGATAKELHLGFSRRQDSSAATAPRAAPRRGAAQRPATGSDVSTSAPAASTKTPTAAAGKRSSGAAAKPADDDDEGDDDDEIPGTVKSYDDTRHLLVVNLLNGKSRSFILAKDLKVLVRGKPSKQGVADPAIKADAHVTVLVEPGGRRVKELHVVPAPATRSKKAA
jgi:hypothetical protein